MQPAPPPPRSAAAAAAVATAAAPVPQQHGTAGQPHSGQPTTFLRLEFISDKETQRILLIQRAVSLSSWAFLAWMLVSQSVGRHDSLMRSSQTEIVNICVASVCLVPLLAVGAWFGARTLAALRCPTTVRWGRQRRYLLAMTGLDLVLQLINLAIFLGSNIYSLVYPCALYAPAMDVFFLLSMTTVNTLFFCSLSRPLSIFPEGTLHRMKQRWAARGWLGRCAAAIACCYCGSGAAAAPPAKGSSGARAASGGSRDGRAPTVDSGSSSRPGSWSKAAIQPPPEAEADVEGGKEVDNESDAEDWEPSSAGHRRAMRLGHVLLFCLLWVPLEALVAAVTASSMGAFGSESLFVCLDSSCSAKMPWRQARDELDWEQCRSFNWECTLDGYSIGLSAAVGGLFLVYSGIFLLLMFFVLMEYRRLAYTPHRVMNVVARLLLRTRGYASFFFIIAVATVFYLNVNSCNANLQLWLGLTPVYISWTILDITEAVLYCPSEPKDCALKLHSLLQKFSWTESEAPAMHAERGLPDEPLFCFETALKLSYYCMHIYRHFNPQSTVSSLQTALALYNCDHYEWIREPVHDMNCLLCWGRDTLVITFRGTQSLANVKADAKVWRSPHPPVRGKLWLGSRPMIHSGFLASWNGEGLDQQVLLRVRQILEGQQHSYSEGSSSGSGHGGKEGSGKEGDSNHGSVGKQSNGSGSGMVPFETTVVRCCSRAHEHKEAELAKAAAAARAAEAAEAGSAGHVHVDEAELEAAASQLLSMASPFMDSSSIGLAGSAGTRSRGGSMRSMRSTASSTASSAGQPFRIFVTGHSLGGAVGTLCAFDIERELQHWGYATVPSPFSAVVPAPAGNGGGGGGSGGNPGGARGRPVSVTCYTYGAPRTGNHAFANEMVERVPDTWAVINDQDLVAKAGKFLFLFKRCGHVTLINPEGDLIVNPSFLELNVQRSSYHASVSQHLLLSYNKSLAAILRGQHEGKSISGGVEAFAVLTSNPAVRELLVRPLAIRMVSLRRYIHRSLPSVPESVQRFGSTTDTAGKPEATAAAAGHKEADLSGMGEGDDETAVPKEGEVGPLTGMQRLASTVREMAQGML